jgi:thiamine-phosphate pyrophosphorylase
MLLQYIIKGETEEDIMAQARAALDAGIVWLEIKAAESVPDDVLASILDSLRSELAEKNCVLILADRLEAAKELKADGVHLYDVSRPASAARVALEAWPIIGVDVSCRADAESLRGYDIDYLVAHMAGDESLGLLGEIAGYLAEKDVETPLVAAGNINAGNISAIAGAGANAVAIDASVACGAESLCQAVSEMKKLADAL